MDFWTSINELSTGRIVLFFVAMVIAFGFEFINGFHDTANAVATVIYTRTLKPLTAVLYSGIFNAAGVIVGGTTVAFGIVNLLPASLLVDSTTNAPLIMVLSLLIAGVIWNLGTWYAGLPVSSSHTLIGSIIGVGIANSLAEFGDLSGLQWSKVIETGLALLLSPLAGFAVAFVLLKLLQVLVRNPEFYQPATPHTKTPMTVRVLLTLTCGGVSFAHGSNDGQKGMGLLMLVLVGFMPVQYALDTRPDQGNKIVELRKALIEAEPTLAKSEVKIDQASAASLLKTIRDIIGDHPSFEAIPTEQRWDLHKALFELDRILKKAKVDKDYRLQFTQAYEFVPLWVVIGTALALGIGTTIGYKRIVITVAEKIGKQHLNYAQGVVASAVTAVTIALATRTGLPVSTTHILSSGIAGSMAANGSGIQAATAKKILLAWIFTLPVTMLMSGVMFTVGRWIFA